MTDDYFLHVIHNETSSTKKETEQLIALLNDDCQMVDQFGFGDEQYFILYKHEHKSETN